MSYYTKAKFLMSAPDIRHLKQDEGIEVAFAGRSNAGKSSALNTLTRQKNLARTSKHRAGPSLSISSNLMKPAGWLTCRATALRRFLLQ